MRVEKGSVKAGRFSYAAFEPFNLALIDRVILLVRVSAVTLPTDWPLRAYLAFEAGGECVGRRGTEATVAQGGVKACTWHM